ncbi:hypothetical protein BVRB_6g129290 [Beta vulgaris subsp. vulgaris]|nr:hypothetical protein BVRB_6g129290 [Beta vulgaris subsp. vulgaris]
MIFVIPHILLLPPKKRKNCLKSFIDIIFRSHQLFRDLSRSHINDVDHPFDLLEKPMFAIDIEIVGS